MKRPKEKMITARKAFGAGLWVMEALQELGPSTAREIGEHTGRSYKGAMPQDLTALGASEWIESEPEPCMGGRFGFVHRHALTEKGRRAMVLIKELEELGVYHG